MIELRDKVASILLGDCFVAPEVEGGEDEANEYSGEVADEIIALCMDAAVEAVESSRSSFSLDAFVDELIATGDAVNAIKALKERNDD